MNPVNILLTAVGTVFWSNWGGAAVVDSGKVEAAVELLPRGVVPNAG